MKVLKFRLPDWLRESYEWGNDVDRIVAICLSNGFAISKSDAHHAWSEHSDNYAAGWLILGDDDKLILDAVLEQCEITDYKAY